MAEDALEAGIAWLVNLPDATGQTSDDDEALRLYPSRFKTLAWLGEFNDAQLRADFEVLSQRLDGRGALQKVMARQSLATMVYADCLDHLALRGVVSELWEARRSQVLDNIEQKVMMWHAGYIAKDTLTEVLTLGELSYGFDLLLRAGRIDMTSAVALDVHDALISVVQTPSWRPLSSDTLYCALQLAAHFRQSPLANQALIKFIAELRTKYEKRDLKKESFFLHPLVLRILVVFHGDHLLSEVSRLLLEGQQERMKIERQGEDLRRREDFQSIIKNGLDVQITDVRPLTGGISQAQVFRVYYSVRNRHTNVSGEIETSVFLQERSSMVIKQGKIDTLLTSIRRYQGLPGSVRDYFARHEGHPVTFGAQLSTPAYLVMEDLAHMQTLRDKLDPIDQRTLPRAYQDQIRQMIDVICDGLFAIYDRTKRPASEFSGSHLSRLYIGDAEKSLIRMCREGAYPHLKTWHRSFKLGLYKYRSIGFYLSKIESHRGKLRMSHLMLTHGDCHSRNLMLDRENKSVKLVDLDNLDYDGDYLKDLALLIEDVCVFRFLFDDSYRFHLERERVNLILPTSRHGEIQNQIEYPPFSSAATLLFQQRMLTHIEAYANGLKDECWKERLWLALAVSLMYLVPKHPEKEVATILYVEAVKLLEDLVLHLTGEESLPAVPFPGRHTRADGSRVAKQHADGTDPVSGNPRLAALHQAILGIDPATLSIADPSGHIVRYFRPGSEHPFALVDARRSSVSVLLACSVSELDDPIGIAHARGGKESVLRTLLAIPESIDISALTPMLQKALSVASSSQEAQ